MRIFRSLSRVPRQIHGSFTSAYRLNGAGSDSPRSHRIIDEICQSGNAFRTAVSGGSQLCGFPYFSDPRTKDSSFFTSFHLQVQFKGAHITNANNCKPLAVADFQRRFMHGGPALLSLMAANLGVLAMWYRMDARFMRRNFVFSIANIMGGRLHTVLTSGFSHVKVDHLLWNMLGLFCFGGILERLYGGVILLSLYAGGAVSGSFGHLLYFGRVYPWLKKIPRRSYDVTQTPGALGASGAVTGLTILFILNYPSHTIFLMFFPMPAAIAGCVIIGRDVYLAVRGDSDISVGGHLGGALYGVIVYTITRLVSA